MKYFSSITLLCFLSSPCFCQVWANNGAAINILPGTAVTINNLENNSGTITNNGTITLNYNCTNMGTMNGNGNYNIGNNWNSTGIFTPGTGVVMFNGGMMQNVFSSSVFNNCTINKSAGSVILSSNITINGVLNFLSGNIQTGSNKIIISSTGSIIGTSQSTGWVNGKLQKDIPPGNTSQPFELGDNANYTPATIVFNGVIIGGNLIADVIATDHPNIIISGIDDNKSVNRYFSFTNNGIVFTDASVTLNWVASDIDAGASTANFKATVYNGSAWVLPAIAPPNPTSIPVTGITSFGDFAVGEMLSVLPVKLTNLKGFTKNQGIQVEWTTQSESNMDRYEIERSANGQQFTKAGAVKAKGNSSIINYGWFDANPFNTINYYRIRSVETTGQVSYSHVVKVNISTGKSEIIFYPNPVIGNTIKLQLNNIAPGNYSLILTNTLGQQVFKKLILHNGGSAMQSIAVNNLPKGIYFLHVAGGGINFTKRVLKD